MTIKISKILNEITEEPRVSLSSEVYNFDSFKKENNNIILPKEDYLFFKEEITMRNLLGKNWREDVSSLYGKETPHLILENLDKMFKNSCKHDIHSLKEAERLWSKNNNKGAKIENIVGFLSCDSEASRTKYIKAHGISSNLKIFAKLFSKNILSKSAQILLSHGAVLGLGFLGVASSPLLFPLSLLAIGLSVISIKTVLTLPKSLEKLELYKEENQMVLSRTNKSLNTNSLKRNLEYRKASFEEVSDLISKMDLKTKFALRNMSLQNLRNFADDVFEKQKKYLMSGIKKTEKEISKEVYLDYQKDPENSIILKSGHKDTLKDFTLDFLFLSIPVGLEAFEVFEKAFSFIPENSKKDIVDFLLRTLSKVPEFIALYKETTKEHKIEQEDLTHSKNSKEIIGQIINFLKSPLKNNFSYNECDIVNFEPEVSVLQIKSREDLIFKLKKNNKKPLVEAIENINKKIM